MHSEYKTLLPEWTWTTNRDELPAELNWNGWEDAPPVGAQVMVDSKGEWQEGEEENRFHVLQNDLGDTGLVAGYSHENGNLRVVVFQDNPPQELQTPSGYYPVHLLGSYVYQIGFVGADELPKPSLMAYSLDFLTPAARVAATAERAAKAAYAAARAADKAAAYARAAYEATLPAAVKSPAEAAQDLDNDLPF